MSSISAFHCWLGIESSHSSCVDPKHALIETTTITCRGCKWGVTWYEVGNAIISPLHAMMAKSLERNAGGIPTGELTQ
jgi:hypothetical protein